MDTVLITGATGFVGSAIAANLLANSFSVIALSRNDPRGDRTLAAIAEAAKGFQLGLANALTERLSVCDANLDELEGTMDTSRLSRVTVAWHCAAEMSYSPRSLQSSFNTNTEATGRLYRLLCQHAPRCQRFYYMSTAYVSRFSASPVSEKLPVEGFYVTPYHASKAAAELLLHTLHTIHRLPVTLFRPTVIVGHERFGWTRCNGFGLYMYADVMDAVIRAGLSEVMLDIPHGPQPDLIPIDRLVDDAMGLTARGNEGSEFEVFHCSGGRSISFTEIVSLVGQLFGIRICYGAPVTQLEEQLDWALQPRKPFVDNEWHFDRSLLDKALHRTHGLPPLGHAAVRGLFEWYKANQATCTSSLRMG